MRRVNFLARIGANKCYRNEINSAVYARRARARARAWEPVSSLGDADAAAPQKFASDIRQLESMPGRVRARKRSERARISPRNGKFLSNKVATGKMAALNASQLHSWRMMIGRSTPCDKLSEQASYISVQPTCVICTHSIQSSTYYTEIFLILTKFWPICLQVGAHVGDVNHPLIPLSIICVYT